MNDAVVGPMWYQYLHSSKLVIFLRQLGESARVGDPQSLHVKYGRSILEVSSL